MRLSGAALGPPEPKAGISAVPLRRLTRSHTLPTRVKERRQSSGSSGAFEETQWRKGISASPQADPVAYSPHLREASVPLRSLTRSSSSWTTDHLSSPSRCSLSLPEDVKQEEISADQNCLRGFPLPNQKAAPVPHDVASFLPRPERGSERERNLSSSFSSCLFPDSLQPA